MLALNITIREPIQPLDRGDRYEDPVAEALEELGLGSAGDGGGTLVGEHGEIDEVDFDVEVANEGAIEHVIRVLEDNGAPKGSRIVYNDKTITFGKSEGVAVYLDGINLPDEIYQSTSAQELVDKCVAALDGKGEFRHSWQGPTETALYFYGSDADEMFGLLGPALREYPLSRTARVVLRHGSSDPAPSELKLAEAN